MLNQILKQCFIDCFILSGRTWQGGLLLPPVFCALQGKDEPRHEHVSRPGRLYDHGIYILIKIYYHGNMTKNLFFTNTLTTLTPTTVSTL